MDDGMIQYFYVDGQNEAKGPIFRRDVEVLLQTGELNSNTFMWKEGLTEWKPLFKIEELRRVIVEDTKEYLENIAQFQAQQERDQQSVLEEEEGEANKAVDSDPKKQMVQKTESEVVSSTANQGKDENQEHGEQNEEEEEKISGKRRTMEPTEEELKEMIKKKEKRFKQKERKKQKWYTARINTNIFISGLPMDNSVTADELKEFFKNCGAIRLNPHTGEEIIKLYYDDDETFKGEARISFANPESVAMAIDMLDGSIFRNKYKIKVEKAVFEQKGDDYKARETVKVDPIKQKEIKMKRQKMLTWKEDDQVEGLQIVVFKRVFTVDELSKHESLGKNLEIQFKKECEERVGPVQKIKVYSEHPDGVIQVKFLNATDAEKCFKAMTRWRHKEIGCEWWDGKTDYRRIAETEEEKQRREDDFGKWLEEGSSDSEDEDGYVR